MGPRVSLFVAGVLMLAASVQAQDNARFRTFPEFVGTWILDEAASTGRMRMAPLPPRTVTIATITTEVTITSTIELPPETPGREGKRTATETPPPEVYRFDGTPTVRYVGLYEYTNTFSLVADALALTTKTSNWVRRGDPLMSNRNAFTAVTDAYSVEGDVLTLHRQLTSVNGEGQLAVMQTNNSRHTYVYRRAPARAAE
jgi:hypothetical protein